MQPTAFKSGRRGSGVFGQQPEFLESRDEVDVVVVVSREFDQGEALKLAEPSPLDIGGCIDRHGARKRADRLWRFGQLVPKRVGRSGEISRHIVRSLGNHDQQHRPVGCRLIFRMTGG